MKTHTKMIVHFIALRKSHYVILLFCAALILPATLTAQVAIGDSLKAAHPSAGLEVFSESKGFLPPRLTTAQRDSIASPADGLMVYDTDLNKLLYYHNGWNDFGLWSTLDSTGVNIFYTQGRVVVGAGSDTLPALPGSLTVTGFGNIGILSYSRPDTAFVANSFIAELDNTLGHSGNFYVQTFSSGGENVAHGVYSYMESDAPATFANTSQAYYNGAGGSLNSLEDIPLVVASGGDVYVEDTSAEVVAVAARNIAESDHSGMNLGSYASALSENTRANIGSVAVANTDDQFEMLDTMLLGVFPGRFTIGQFIYNAAADTNDYGLYSAGDAQNYFGGSVGIGTLAPTKKLDVAGAVNATAYYLNGDSLTFTGVWEQNGDDISYDNGRVKIGKPFPAPYASDLSVRGNVVFASDSAKENYIGSYFAMDVDSVWGWEDTLDRDHHFLILGVKDTIENDTIHMGIAMGSFDEGMLSWWGYEEESNANAQRIYIVKRNGSNGIQIASDDGNTSIRQTFHAGEVRTNVQVNSSEMNTLLKTTGFGINTTSPDTELHVNGNIKQSITTSNVSNPPTDAELDTLFTSPASKGDGWTAYVQDSNTNNFYQIVASGNNWIVFTGTVAP